MINNNIWKILYIMKTRDIREAVIKVGLSLDSRHNIQVGNKSYILKRYPLGLMITIKQVSPRNPISFLNLKSKYNIIINN